MNLTSKDMATIEQALNDAIRNCNGYRNSLNYREVLNKLQNLPRNDNQQCYEVTSLDGLRYDYDDSK
ncbi:hypothetical protein [Chengkuizengella axinellae]|uniref:Uncharacterized protein n=1 Tax=Chengkuizengella axinellae TaxID=3064388 RepID=A0ABT9IXG2_9BACL|nr:hypothetical protein [Chengkuizengella sp. 2205SS18-9]MDP5274042.1 hypothetical protein [Chengkuizengella sp. 2205SS18-9]